MYHRDDYPPLQEKIPSGDEHLRRAIAQGGAPSIENIDFLADLLNVGVNKPMGYLACGDIESVCRVSADDVMNGLKDRGLQVVLYKKLPQKIVPNIVFVYDRTALQKLLNENADILFNSNWPMEADGFVDAVAHKTAQPGTELFNLIALAFGNPKNMREISPPSIPIYRIVIDDMRRAAHAVVRDMKILLESARRDKK
ncbi:hypothetical protein KBD59_04200 [Candidatus Gracilibacteria bacterium]|nr:hypothetical protein [Candidatus Gracilibacteria bacterium]